MSSRKNRCRRIRRSSILRSPIDAAFFITSPVARRSRDWMSIPTKAWPDGRFRFGVRIAVQELREAGLIKIAHRTFSIGLNPLRVLGAKVVVDLMLERGDSIDQARPARWIGQSCSATEHIRFDKKPDALVQTIFRTSRGGHLAEFEQSSLLDSLGEQVLIS